ncbi:MAG: TauD/TfdA family dioxygenase [Akkermansiaceae bacterium]|nr:TauD/TfdA family dioxygenase [Akkermansiaceae bacterium]MCP5551804.1 TauD/TfdA family dioxygenase [Akkermansiaceae bacterium]
MGETNETDPNRMHTWRFLEPSELTRPTHCPELPRVIEAGGPRSLADLRDYVTAEGDRLRAEMRARGGFLLRGFELNDPESFADIIGALGYRPEAENPFDTSPRHKVAASVYTSTDTPDPYPILAHNENSFLNARPRMISFFCFVEPPRYGETPLFDSRAAAATLDPSVREKLAARKVCYRRRLPKKRPAWAPNINRTWSEAFGTEDRDTIEEMVAERGMTCRWHPNGRLLHTENVVDPLPVHPDTGDRCLNLQAFHRTSILGDLDEVRPRQNPLHNASLKMGVSLLYALDAMPVQILYGDGSPIPPAEMAEIRRATWEHSVLFAWKKGDLLVLDNILTGHGRMNVEKPRKILTSFGDIVTFPV